MPRKPKIIRRRIKPTEAGEIASRFRSAANRVSELAARLERAANELDPTWEGNSRDYFFADYAPTPTQLKTCAETLNRLATEIDSITVEQETVVNL